MRQKMALILGLILLASGPANAGTATYSGAVYETGVTIPLAGGGLDPGDTFTWIPNGDGTWSIDSSATGGTGTAGRVKGNFTLDDGATLLTVPNGTAYTVTGGVIIPSSGLDADGANYRFYLGLEPSITAPNQIGIVGIEWNTTLSQWVQGSDNSAILGNNTPLTISAGDLFEVLVTRDGTGAMLCQYRINGGAWTDFYFAYGAQPISAALLSAYDGGDDRPQWSIRGEWTTIQTIVISGDAGIQDVNVPPPPAEGEGEPPIEGEGEAPVETPVAGAAGLLLLAGACALAGALLMKK